MCSLEEGRLFQVHNIFAIFAISYFALREVLFFHFTQSAQSPIAKTAKNNTCPEKLHRIYFGEAKKETSQTVEYLALFLHAELNSV